MFLFLQILAWAILALVLGLIFSNLPGLGAFLWVATMGGLLWLALSMVNKAPRAYEAGVMVVIKSEAVGVGLAVLVTLIYAVKGLLLGDLHFPLGVTLHSSLYTIPACVVVGVARNWLPSHPWANLKSALSGFNAPNLKGVMGVLKSVLKKGSAGGKRNARGT